tara:strand:+ start:6225 stop:6443 length:219 start_codon:yes stop_codon:yes gene_type:complete
MEEQVNEDNWNPVIGTWFVTFTRYGKPSHTVAIPNVENPYMDSVEAMEKACAAYPESQDVTHYMVTDFLPDN